MNAGPVIDHDLANPAGRDEPHRDLHRSQRFAGSSRPTGRRPRPPTPLDRRRQERIHRQLDHRPGGARGGPQAARHVHRLHLRARAAPPGVGGRRQLRRRGARRARATGSRSTLLADGGVRVIDNGRGMPVDMHPTQKKPTVEVILTVLHAGGKFDGKAYAVSGGLHGVGVSVVNALCHRLEVEIERDGYDWTPALRRPEAGRAAAQGRADPAAPAPRSRSGPTPTIFETTEYSFETISRRLQEMAFLNKGLTIVAARRAGRPDRRRGRRDAPRRAKAARPKEVTYHYAGGIADFVKHLNAHQGPDPQGRDLLRGRGRASAAVGRGRDAVERVLLRERLHLRQHDQHASRAAPTRRASGPR